MRKILLGVTTTYGSDWKEKIKEIKKFKLKEVAFFVTCLDKKQRQEFYDLVKTTGVEAPFVHIRSDMEVEELDYLVKNFKTKVFNIHTEREYPLEYDLSKYQKKIFVENIFFGLSEEEVKKWGGICLDLAHLDEDSFSRKDKYKKNKKIIERNFIGCNHISAILKEPREDKEAGFSRHDCHFLNNLSELNYLRKYPLSYFSDYVAIELENTLEEQLKIREYIIKIINSKKNRGKKRALRSDFVKLAKYNPEWKAFFKKEKTLFQKTFGKTIIGIQHIGSTSIPGLVAKPIIDINIGVKSLKVAKEMKEKFRKIGYEYKVLDLRQVKNKNRKKVEEQELYIKKIGLKDAYHVHVTVYGSDYWKRDLFFRDYIANNPLMAKKYAELKKSLAKKYPYDIIKYSSGKDPFITQALKLCLKPGLSQT